MPKKKEKSKGLSGKNVIHLHNCSGFQVGLNNELTIKDVPKKNRKSTKDILHAKNETGKLIVQNVLMRHTNGLTLFDLRFFINEEIQGFKENTFIEITGRSVEDFLKFNKAFFELSSKHKGKVVRLRGKSKGDKSTLDGVANEDKLNDDLIDKETDEACANVGTVERWIEHPDAGELQNSENIHDQESFSEESSNNWIEVKSKSSHTKQRVKRCVYSDNCGTIEEDGKVLDFLHIVYKKEALDTIFVEDSCEYIVSPLKCMLDIVSLWNTPQLAKSYILIGIKASSSGNELYGVTESCEEDYWQMLFTDRIFTMKPNFSWHEINHDSKLFYMIEVSSSCGQGQPSIVKTDFQTGDISLSQNELWCRRGVHNVVCKQTDPFTACIYQWFLGSKQHSIRDQDISISGNVRESSASTLQTTPIQTNASLESAVTSDCDGFLSFWKSVNGFKKGSFVLVSAGISNKIRNIHQLGLLPWLAIYDFDVFSYSTGICNSLQDIIENERNLQMITWREASATLSETGTLWCFMRGREELEDSRTDREYGSIEDVHDWTRQVRSGLQEQCERLANFIEDCSPLTIVLLWPVDENLAPHVCKFIDKIVDNLSYRPTIVILLEAQPQSPAGITRLDFLKEEFKNHLHIIQIRLDNLFHGIQNHLSTKKETNSVYDLPSAESSTQVAITKKEANWLNEDFEVLYLSNPYADSEDEIEEKIGSFYKGGSLPWSVWYKLGHGEVEIERDKFDCLSRTIEPRLDNFKTHIINLFHAPGSGGSTLAKRILWKFHTRVPCLHLKLGTINRSKEIVQKVAFVQQNTKLPILMLIDGEEASKIKYLSNALRYTIILYVKRYPYKVQHELQKDKVYISGTVSTKEAEMLASKYRERCEEKKRKALARLSNEVKDGKSHLLFEFGMTVYHHEFKGIRAFVRGYLRLESNPTHDLLPWQKCVAYLALVYYYGQSSVPCQFFAALFGKPANYAMTLMDDFQYPLTEFVVNDTNDKRNNNIRICHYAVAQEILEQILSRFAKGAREERSDQLSLAARRNLGSLCIDFIEYTKKKKNGRNSLSMTVRLILARTFIFRDEKDMGENQEQERRRPVLSKLMVDIPAGKPLFTERLQILEKLVSSYPDDPNFQAHIGRFYAFCRSDEEEKVEKHFKEAISLCDKLQKGRSEADLDDGTKSTMTHVYHMYGIVKHRYLTKYTGRSQHDEAKKEATEESFFETMKELVEVAKLSCYYFMRSRQLTPDTREVYTYAYTGEIQVRLQMCDYVKRFFKDRTDNENVFEAFFLSNADVTSKEYIKEGITTIGALIHECYTDVELSSDDTLSLRTLVSWYNELFKRQRITIERNEEYEDNESRRIAISLMMMKNASGNILGDIESIRDRKTIQTVVELYEQNIDESVRLGCNGPSDKKKLENDYRQWIYAIRHEEFPDNYNLEDVYLRVQKWHELVRSPSSTLYLFILQSLIGFDTETSQGKTECLFMAKETKQEMTKMNRLIIRPKYPREWLGCRPGGIKMLVSGNRHVGVCPEEREGNGPSMTGLKVCKGTIRHPNTNSIGGYIEYNMAISNVAVFFIPKRVKLIGARFAGRRVQFNLAFSVEKGYEAFDVKLLKRHACPSCNNVLEFASSENVRKCSCGIDVYKDQVNEVDQDSEA